MQFLHRSQHTQRSAGQQQRIAGDDVICWCGEASATQPLLCPLRSPLFLVHSFWFSSRLCGKCGSRGMEAGHWRINGPQQGFAAVSRTCDRTSVAAGLSPAGKKKVLGAPISAHQPVCLSACLPICLPIVRAAAAAATAHRGCRHLPARPCSCTIPTKKRP